MLLSKIIGKQFDAVLGRYDRSLAEYYFSPQDFPGIKEQKFPVKGSAGILRGAFYFYDKIDPEKFIIFDHGIGSGYLAYFKEIEYLARQGYTVYAYDHTGCMTSEGKGILGFSQGIHDLDRVITSIKKDLRFQNAAIRIIGHSWGGYSAMNVVPFHPEVTHVVSLAGFLSAKALIEQYLPKFALKYSSEVMEQERMYNPDYADLNAGQSIKRSKVHLFHIQSKDDKKVFYSLCTEPLSKELKGRKNTVILTVDHHGHDPHRTIEGAKAHEDEERELKKLTRKGKLKTKKEQEDFRKARDWNKITELDLEIWDQILEFLS